MGLESGSVLGPVSHPWPSLLCQPRCHRETSLVLVSCAALVTLFLLLSVQRQVEVNVRNKILYLIQAWAHAFRNEPKYKVVQDTYQIMKVEGELGGVCPRPRTQPPGAEGQLCARRSQGRLCAPRDGTPLRDGRQ